MRLVLFLLLITCSVAAHANDTLTRAQIYNFNVGDTFDYKEHVTYAGYTVDDGETINFRRCIIRSIFYSVSNDTQFVVREWMYPSTGSFDTLVIDSLQYPVVSVPAPYHSCQNVIFSIDTSSLFNGSVCNAISGSCNDTIYNFHLSFLYSLGLGATLFYVDSLPFEGDDIEDSTYLIYYANNTTHWGTPYYIANDSSLVQYIPIPEECATWVTGACYQTPCPATFQKTTTGNRIPYGGHTYVELLCTGFICNNDFVTDSLIGYFRNDTINRKAYVYRNWASVTDSVIWVEYDFGVAAGPVLSLTQVNVGGQLRTQWNEVPGGYSYLEGAYSSPDSSSYIAGVGSTSGIFPVGCIYTEQGQQFLIWNHLTCFSVCGQTLYPYDSTANCSLASINNVAAITPEIKVYPNLNNGIFNVEILNQSLQDAQLLITDITGRGIKRCPLNNQLNNVSIEHAANGMYIWQVLSRDKLVQTGKLVKQ